MSKRAPPLAEISLLKSETIGQYRHDLLITKLRVGKTIATCLIDSGTTHNFLSDNWVEKAKPTNTDRSEQIAITVADGRDWVLKQRTISVLSLDLGGYLWRQTFTVTLNGGKWHHPRQTMAFGQSASDTIQEESSKASGKAHNRNIIVRCLSSKNDCQEEERPPIEFMSAKQARQALMKRGNASLAS